MKLSTKNSIRNKYPWFVCVGAGNVHRILATPTFENTGISACATLNAWICSQYMPMSNRPATNDPKT